MNMWRSGPMQRLRGMTLLLAVSASCTTTYSDRASVPVVRVGSKSFTESVVLGEIATQIALSTGAHAEHRKQLGGTRILWNALLNGEIDIYPEYSGTISQEIFAGEGIHDLVDIRTELQQSGIELIGPLGFNNTYAIGMLEVTAERMGIRTISDLGAHPELRFGFSNEFLDRGDGWPSLRQRYDLPQRDVVRPQPVGIHQNLELPIALAPDGHVRHARNRHQPRTDDPLRQRAHFHLRQCLGRDTDLDGPAG